MPWVHQYCQGPFQVSVLVINTRLHMVWHGLTASVTTGSCAARILERRQFSPKTITTDQGQLAQT